MSFRFGIRLKCSISLLGRIGDLLRRVQGTLRGMPLFPICLAHALLYLQPRSRSSFGCYCVPSMKVLDFVQLDGAGVAGSGAYQG